MFCGKAQSGKSTSAALLAKIIEKRNKEESSRFCARTFSFATKLKELSKELFDWDGDKGIYMHDIEVPDGRGHITVSRPIPDKGRQLLIYVGQYMRSIRPTVWVDYIKKLMLKWFDDSFLESHTHAFAMIDDCRFRNELDTFKQMPNCYTIKISRSSQLDLNDISEKDLDGFTEYDYEIDNNNTTEKLEESIDRILTDILAKS